MRTIKAIILALAIIASAIHANAIEHLEISVQCTNAVLRWPCLDDGSEQFIVQYRGTLSPADSWQTLETSLPATYGTNEMYYTNWGVVLNPVNCDGGGGFSMMMMGGGEEMLSSTPSEPMATLNGTSNAVPTKLFPNGFDFSNFTISVPGTSGSLRGTEFMQAEDAGDPLDPNGGGEPSGVGGTNVPPDIGFYRVVRVGPHLMGITNGQVLSGVVQIPVEIGGAQGGQLANLTLTENDSPVGTASIHAAPFELPVPLVTLDTTRMTNGVHQIAAIASWEFPTDTNDNSGSYEYDCAPITVTVSNEISFPNWFDSFGELGNTLLISAVSAHTNIDYYIDIYGANAGYIGTLGGHSDDGIIYGYWDLQGPDGTVYTNEPSFQFEISTPYIDPPTPPTYKQADPWPGNGKWVIVAQHAFDNILDHETLYSEADAFVGPGGAAGGVLPATGTGTAYGIPFHDTGEVSAWTTFKQAITNRFSRNLFYFGHGSPNGLGYNQGDTNRSILAGDLAKMLNTIPAGLSNRHAYRMVILDGCSTAAGTLPESFGIKHVENVDPLDYLNASMRQSAFAGWTAEKWVGFLNGGAVNYDHVNFIIHLEYELAGNGNGIRQAIDNAGRYPDVHFVTPSEMKAFGCWSLNFWSFNN
jgi:hypothetical protein